MFRKMRRQAQALSREETLGILSCAGCGTLALSGDNGYPYAVPLSFAFDGDKTVYFHSALTGHKIDSVKRSSKASLCVIDRDEIVPEEFTTHYRSVIAFGKVRIVAEAEEKLRAIKLLAEKYSPDEPEERTSAEIEGAWDRFCIVAMELEHITGKEARELSEKKCGQNGVHK